MRFSRILALTLLFATAPAARAHEPLWGETPITFGFGVIHPEVKLKYMDAGSTAPGGSRMRMFEQEYMVDYGFNPKLNVRLMIPHFNNRHEMRVGGRVRSTHVSGLGDIHLRAKQRISARQDVGLNIQQAIFYGVKLPTGSDDHRDARGRRLDPHSQTGTGNPGLVLGYAWDRETLQDTTWASVTWSRDIGGGFRMGDMVDLSLAYGYWIIPQNEASDLGLNFAAGIYGQYHADDPLGNGRDADNGHQVLGLQFTPIVTKGTHQFRLGVFLPLVRSGPSDHTDYDYELRFAYETFF